ncbi:MAG: hypothetical protein ACK4Z6_07995 [Candidatus Methylomirabilales bacterium]
MAMVETWLVGSGILLVFALLLLIPIFEAGERTIVGKAFWCPFKKIDVVAELIRTSVFGESRYVDVKSCSAFADPSRVTCRKRCLEILHTVLGT